MHAMDYLGYLPRTTLYKGRPVPTYDNNTERIVGPVLQKFARYWSSKGAGDIDDLAQEGRIALSKALQTYRPDRANLRTYAAGVLQRTFTNALRDRLRRCRAPHVWE